MVLLGLKKVHLESDSNSLVHSLLYTNYIDHFLINIIKKMLLQNWEVMVSHTYREDNLCVDWMANFSTTIAPGTHRFAKPAQGIFNLL